MEHTPEIIQNEINALHAEIQEIKNDISLLLLNKKASIERQERQLKNRLTDINAILQKLTHGE